MADPITWYLLPRRVDDPTTIEEMINEKILEHNQDPSAHGQSDEAIYLHRISSILDHVNYSIYNIKLHPISRPIKAFVDAGGAAEFSRVQDAITYVNALGGGKIFIKEGVYYLDDDLILYSNLDIEGEDNDTTILDFQNNAKGIVLTGTSTNHKRNVHLKNIQVRNVYGKRDGAIYFNYVDDVSIVNCKFSNISGSPPGVYYSVVFDEVIRGNIEKCYATSVSGFVNTVNSTKVMISANYCDNTSFYAVRVYGGNNISILDNYFYDTNEVGIQLDAAISTQIRGNHIKVGSANAIILNESGRCLIDENYLEGGSFSESAISIFEDSYDNRISNNIIYNFSDIGIYIFPADKNVIVGNRITNCSTGIYISSSSDRNLVVSNNLYGTTTPLTDNGSNTLKGYNLIS